MNRGELFPVSGDVAVFRPTHEGKIVLFGSLPAHPKLSDNVNAGNDVLPLKTFAYAITNSNELNSDGSKALEARIQP